MVDLYRWCWGGGGITEAFIIAQHADHRLGYDIYGYADREVLLIGQCHGVGRTNQSLLRV